MAGRLSDEQRKEILDAVRDGTHPSVACVAAGLHQGFYRDQCYQARQGREEAQQLVQEIATAAAQSERIDVACTARAVQPIDGKAIECPTCGEEYNPPPEQLMALASRIEGMQKAKSSAAEVALKKLERRHPKRWSQKIVLTVQEEHERILNVFQRLLTPEVFESCLEEYLAEGSGESETSGSTSEPTGGGVH